MNSKFRRNTFCCIAIMSTVLLIAACGGMQERPEALAISYGDALRMSQHDFNKEVADSSVKADRMTELEKAKFGLGDAVEYRVGTLEIQAVYYPLLKAAHFTFVNDPRGLEGDVTTATLIVYVEEDGLIAKDEKSGHYKYIVNDIGRSPDVGRLIISKLGDIVAFATTGAVAAPLLPAARTKVNVENTTGDVNTTAGASAGSANGGHPNKGYGHHRPSYGGWGRAKSW